MVSEYLDAAYERGFASCGSSTARGSGCSARPCARCSAATRGSRRSATPRSKPAAGAPPGCGCAERPAARRPAPPDRKTTTIPPCALPCSPPGAAAGGGWPASPARRASSSSTARRYQLELPGARPTTPAAASASSPASTPRGLLDRDAVHPASAIPFRHLRRVHSRRLPRLADPAGRAAADRRPAHLRGARRAGARGAAHDGRRHPRGPRLALASRQIAVSLGGGLHHAFAAKGERFCVYNDVAAAIAELRAHGFTGAGAGGRPRPPRRRRHALDLRRRPHGPHLLDPQPHLARDRGRGGDGDRAGGRRRRTAPTSTPSAPHLPPVVERFAPELVFYLAGCDPAADDQIGDWRITAGAMLERDRFVLSCVRAGARSSRW